MGRKWTPDRARRGRDGEFSRAMEVGRERARRSIRRRWISAITIRTIVSY